MIDAASITAYLGLTSVRAPAKEPKGSRIAFISTESGMPQVWLYEDGQTRQITNHPEPVNAIAWNPLGGELLFTADYGGDERWQFWLLDPASGQTRALTEDPMTVHMWGAWSADGKSICYTANTTVKAELDLYVMDLASGKSRCLRQGLGHQEALAFTPDGTQVLTRLIHGAGSDQSLTLVDCETGAETAVLSAPSRVKYSSARLLKAGGGLAICDYQGDRMALWRFDAAGVSMGCLYADPDFDLDAFALSPDQSKVMVLRNLGGWSALVEVPLDLTPTRQIALPAQGVVTSLTLSEEGMLCAIASATRPSAIWQIGFDGAARQLVAGDLPDLAKDFVTPELETFASFDGEVIPYFTYTPAGPMPATGWPVIFIIHGGPEMQWRPDFRADVQWMTAQGIMVVAPNVRGSTGYGRRFHALDDREKRLDAEADVEALRLHLLARSRIDPAKCGIFGRSYGGWMVMSALTEHPASWTFGINFYGIGNFFTHLLATGPWARQMRVAEYGDPLSTPDLLTRTSAIFRAEKIEAPIFMVHADRDPRVPLTESETINSVLFGLGKPCEFLRVAHAGHGFLRAEQSARVFSAMAQFIAKHF